MVCAQHVDHVTYAVMQYVDLIGIVCYAAGHTQGAHRSLLADAFVLVQHRHTARIHQIGAYCIDNNMQPVFTTQVIAFCTAASFRKRSRLCTLSMLAYTQNTEPVFSDLARQPPVCMLWLSGHLSLAATLPASVQDCAAYL